MLGCGCRITPTNLLDTTNRFRSISRDNMSNLFAKSRTKMKLIRNSKILTRKYVPKRIIGRKLEMEKVADILRPCIEEEEGMPLNIIIYGKPGTGKTLVVRYVTAEFKKAVEIDGKQPIPLIVYISCGKISGHVATIRSIIESIDPAAAMPGGYETSEYYNQLYALLNKKKRGLILILDEIDRLPDNKLLYNLSRKHQAGDLSHDIYGTEASDRGAVTASW
jgi:archaeal cell division control protein 6